jgi:NAD(P)-dependent dehydrogenase (short-subunit alcohol dehydrogenase family)
MWDGTMECRRLGGTGIKFIKTVQQGSSGSPEKIADVIAFVASDKASFMTGEVVTVGGDLGAS